MSKKAPPEGALFVRLPATAVDKLDRAAEALGVRKKDLVAGLVSRYVDPDSRRGLHELSAVANRKITVETDDSSTKMGSYSFQAYDPPEVMNAAQAAEFLQVDDAVVVEMAEGGKLPGRQLGGAWRFSRAALVAWLSTPDKGGPER
jgi:excisionase family DNA binding protein